MTEKEWLACADPRPMLEFRTDAMSERKVRLFAWACCQRISHLLVLADSQTALKILEKYADGQASLEDLVAVNRVHALKFSHERLLARGAVDCATFVARGGEAPVVNLAIGAAHNAAWAAAGIAIDEGRRPTQKQLAGKAKQDAIHAALVRDIFGNPFRPAAFDPEWRTSDVLALARGIYEERAFDRMPILADALQDAGCDSDDILNHLRDANALHFRGCWALDLVLGKS
jgi:hypothetical protein